MLNCLQVRAYDKITKKMVQVSKINYAYKSRIKNVELVLIDEKNNRKLETRDFKDFELLCYTGININDESDIACGDELCQGDVINMIIDNQSQIFFINYEAGGFILRPYNFGTPLKLSDYAYQVDLEEWFLNGNIIGNIFEEKWRGHFSDGNYVL